MNIQIRIPNKFFYLLLLGLLFCFLILSGCKSPIDGGVSNGPIPQIFVFPGEQELRLISEEQVPQDNCNGSAETSQIIERSHTVRYLLELGTGVEVSADGRAKIPEIGEVGIGTKVAAEYKVGYGQEETVSRAQTVAAKEGSNIQHTIRQYEVWETGEVLIVAGEINQRLPYSFRRDFSIEALAPANIGCSSTTVFGGDTPPPGPDNETNPTIPIPHLEVSPPAEQNCIAHNSGYCGMVMNLSWENINPKDGYIYLVGYAPNYNPGNYGPWYWIAGTGIEPQNSAGSATIADGAFGNPGDHVEVFACQTPEKYEFSGTQKEIGWPDPPECVAASSAMVLNTKEKSTTPSDVVTELPSINENPQCAFLTNNQIDQLRNAPSVSDALRQAEDFAGHQQNDYRAGDLVPSGVVIATDLQNADYSVFRVTPIKNQGGWGLFLTTEAFSAPNDGTYWCIR